MAAIGAEGAGRAEGNEGRAVDALLTDLQAFQESFWKNESVGESRVQFFLGLVTAVVAALVALVEASSGGDGKLALTDGTAGAVIVFALTSLLVIGWMTLRRIVKRNCVAEEYKQAVDYVRRQLEPFGICGYTPFPKKDAAVKAVEVGVSGLADFVSVVNGLILGALAYSALTMSLDDREFPNAIAALVLAFLFARAQILWAGGRRESFKSEIERLYGVRPCGSRKAEPGDSESGS